MRKILLVLFVFCSLLFNIEDVFAVGGLSNTKVVVPSVETVPKNRIEIEPFFNYLFVDDDYDFMNFDLGTRITYGLADNVELGVSFFFLTIDDSDVMDVDSDFGNIEPGIKWRLFDQEGKGLFAYSIAYEGGFTVPTKGDDETWVFEPVGFVFTKEFNEKFSMDKDIVLRLEEDGLWGIDTNLGLGYFMTDSLQSVVEMAYTYNNVDEEKNEHVVNITAGFTAQLVESATLIFGVTKDLVSKNTEDTLNITTAITFIF